jgi:alcohol dehydrogenase (cytochrome c)
MFRRTYDGWGYSPLADITPENEPSAASLELRHRTDRGHQAPPIVNNGVMFAATPGTN